MNTLTLLNKPDASTKKTLRSPQYLAGISWCATTISACATFFGNLRFGKGVLGLGFTDDFFYYAQVARNLCLHGKSTFDGIHLTNGFHPLWLLILTLLTKLFGIGGAFHATSILPFAAALEAVQVILVIAIAYFAFRVSRKTCSVAVSCGLQALLVIFALILVRTGMEVGLTVAMIFGLLWFRLRADFHWSISRSFCYGLIASAMVLARLDSMLLVALLLLFDVLPNECIEGGRVRNCLAFCAGMGPVAAYVLLNELIFHTLLPVSGTAKQLRLHHVPSLRAMSSLVPYLDARTFFLLGPCVLLTLLALALLATRMRSLPSRSRGVFLAVLAFPFLHILTIVTLSDWNIWEWYLYPWPVAGLVAATMIFSGRRADTEESSSRKSLVFFAASLACLIFYAALIVIYSGPRNNSMYLTGLDIEKFAESHPGIYAMGDRAGAVGYLAGVPVIQLEGLMMDKDYLNNIRARRDLQDVLKQYDVAYYVSTFNRSVPVIDGCYNAREPSQAGPDSPAMQTRICKTPVAAFRHGDFVNYVFDMK